MDDALSKIASNPSASPLYEQIMSMVEDLANCEVEVKKTSLHVVHGRAFLGIHPRRNGLLLNVVTAEPLQSQRLRKTEQVSANRWHNELLVTDPSDVDGELRTWLKQAYLLTER
jgi:hypothetical protein